MKTKGWKSAVRGACLIAAAGLVYQAAAFDAGRATKPCVRETVLRGTGLVTFAGYELNVTLTAEGRLVRFDITGAGD